MVKFALVVLLLVAEQAARPVPISPTQPQKPLNAPSAVETHTEGKPNDGKHAESYFSKASKPDVLPVWIGGIAAVLASAAGSITLFGIKKQTETALLAAQAAKQSADIAAASERAWLITSQLTFRPKWEDLARQGAPITSKIIIEIRNCGRTPAEIESMNAVGILWPSTDPVPDKPLFREDNELFQISFMPGEVIGPNERRFVLCPIRPMDLLTADDLAEIRSGEKIVQCFGRIKYKDVSGTQRETHFGYFYYVRQSATDDRLEAMYRLKSRTNNYST